MIALTPLPTIVLAQVHGGPASGGGPQTWGIGALALTIAVVAVLGWMAYLVVNSRRSRRAAPEEPPRNLTPFLSDDELENRRTTVVLRAALFAAALLAILLPWYAYNEPARQAQAAETLDEEYVAAGHELFVRFGCVGCHGPDAGGGAAAFTESRSGIQTSWVVPSLDDVYYRYSEDEVRYWITYGRPGTPMPANGIAGGGAMTIQEIDQVMAFLRSIQLPQEDVVAKAGPAVDAALNRIASGDQAVADLIAVQQAKIDEVHAAPGRLEVVGSFPERITTLLGEAGTCTVESAKAIETSCASPARDTDRDGLADAVEPELADMAAAAHETLLERNGTQLVPKAAYDVAFDPGNAFTNRTPNGTAVADLDAATAMLQELETDVLLLNVTVERADAFLSSLEDGLAFLQESADRRLWDVDFAAAADRMTARHAQDVGGAASAPSIDVPTATRAAGLFNAYCARCHTGGWSAGTAFEMGPGTGAWGPSLVGGRSVVQFPDWQDQVAFVITGSDNAKPYGVNGIGTGRMPGFGMMLSKEDIELIVMYERSL